MAALVKLVNTVSAKCHSLQSLQPFGDKQSASAEML